MKELGIYLLFLALILLAVAAAVFMLEAAMKGAH